MQCCYPSANLGTVYPHVVAVNSVSSQDAVSHGANSMSSFPFSPPAHSSSPPEEEFTIDASVVPCSVQLKHGPKPHMIYTACNAMT